MMSDERNEVVIEEAREGDCEEVLRKAIKSVGNWFAYKDKVEWLKNMRGNLSMVASIIATLTFQTVINPPGGVFQPIVNPKGNNTLEGMSLTFTNDDKNNFTIRPGEAVLGAVLPHDYYWFLVWNNSCFIASLSVCLFLVSGFPLDHRFPTWLLSMAMCFTLTSLAITYYYAINLVTPDPIWEPATSALENIVLKVWIGLLALVGFILVLRMLVWTLRKLKSPPHTV